jgi:hypothetical protein
MKRPLILSAFAVLAFTAGIALADNPHFIKSAVTLLSNGNLRFTFKEVGLGDAETTYLAGASAAVTCTCVTNSGRCPNAANKRTFTRPAATQATFDPKNGSVNGTIVVQAPACGSSSPPTCGGGQHLELSAISYTDFFLTDVTNGVSADGPFPDSVSTTYFTCP